MKKIFISHKQGYAPAKAIKLLINMMGAQGVLAEEEPGSESPDKRALRLLRESDGFLAICTPDLCDSNKQLSPKQNVSIEIREWQSKHGHERMVIMKHKGCEIPILLGNPTYIEFEGEGAVCATQRMLADFQAMKLIPYLDQISPGQKQNLGVTEKEEQMLIFLAGQSERQADESVVVSKFKFSTTEWNIALNKFYYSDNSLLDKWEPNSGYDPPIVQLTVAGLKYLTDNKIL